jgi:hypothetical protein
LQILCLNVIVSLVGPFQLASDSMDGGSSSPFAGQSAFLDDPMRTPSPSRFEASASSDFGSSHLEPPPSAQLTSDPQPPQPGANASSNGQAGEPALASQPQMTRGSYSQSQYYIIFSVTGIERSNPKNPIIRFDAKVCLILLTCWKNVSKPSRQIYRVSVHL